MGKVRRAITAAVIGAVGAVGWLKSIDAVDPLTCGSGSTGLSCTFSMLLFVAPGFAIAWVLAAWGLLVLAGFAPAWPTALGGIAGVVTLLVVTWVVLIGTRTPVPDGWGVAGLALEAAGGYALAAVVTAGYGVPRDRTEHRGQDG
jgi:hypothetical protein